jgi:hypothetical protein
MYQTVKAIYRAGTFILQEALDVPEDSEGVLLRQVACEYLSASHKLEPLGYSRADAWQDIRDLRRVWITVLPSWGVQDTVSRFGMR